MGEYRRAYQRYSLSAVDAVVAGVVCEVVNVSATGILIDGWQNPPPQGTTGAFTVRAPVEDKVRLVEITGTVMRVQDEGPIAMSFDMPDKDWPRLLIFLDDQEQGRAE